MDFSNPEEMDAIERQKILLLGKKRRNSVKMSISLSRQDILAEGTDFW